MRSCEECEKSKGWRTEYDPILQQTYYVNLDDSSVSFDSPCEVSHKPSKKTGRKGSRFGFGRKSSAESDNEGSPRRSVLTKIGSVLSIKSNRSQDSKASGRADEGSDYAVDMETTSESRGSPLSKYEQDNSSAMYRWDSRTMAAHARSQNHNDNYSVVSGIDDEYLLSNPINFKNFSGTAHASGVNSDDGESIESGDSYSYFYESDNEIRSLHGDNYELEQERQALRYQIANELD